MFNETVANLTCPVEGNADLYGLGIRIGIYIQMLTVQLSGVLSDMYPSVEDHIGQGTIVFVMSAAIVLVRLLNATVSGQHDANNNNLLDRPLQPVEVFPVLTLLLLQMQVCRVSPAKSKTVMLIWMAELVGLTVLFGWFWWHGMDLLPRSCPDDKAFFFAKVSIWNWFRTFNKVGSVLAAVGTGITIVMYGGVVIVSVCRSVFLFFFARRQQQQGNGPSSSSSPSEKTDDDNSNGQRDAWNPQTASLDVFVNVSAIVYVEVSLRWNDIQGVHSLNSPGQFMPFVIALGQLLSVFFTASKAVMQKAADEDDNAFDREDGA
ncbi:hypothetical protein JDV02_003754 [Purpureocillium takamizusanense]|uniref:Uncharacterized protein n=1 Tax=Purpureocillium takamizusanense TaxID=2060973 RepID=A0A9Q8QDS8_9HYPO|nr:uncharacterized protein JDV02_003754 [Purpureocillium takamizusanense]UNI17412.1 hypothetical protein JDV02_003754 [Purpureocillium takamizusanense]